MNGVDPDGREGTLFDIIVGKAGANAGFELAFGIIVSNGKVRTYTNLRFNFTLTIMGSSPFRGIMPGSRLGFDPGEVIDEETDARRKAADDEEKPSGVDLGYAGNRARDRLTSDFEKFLFERFFLGTTLPASERPLVLSAARFQKIVAALPSATPVGPRIDVFNDLLNGEGPLSFQVYRFTDPELDQSIGDGTVFFDGNDKPVGFRDAYNFDTRNLLSPAAARRNFLVSAVNGACFVSGSCRPFVISYGRSIAIPSKWVGGIARPSSPSTK